MSPQKPLCQSQRRYISPHQQDFQKKRCALCSQSRRLMRPTKNIRRNVWLLMLLALPASVAASVQITELMYDLEGADNGFEWVEITNTGSTAVDVGKWRLFERKSTRLNSSHMSI